MSKSELLSVNAVHTGLPPTGSMRLKQPHQPRKRQPSVDSVTKSSCCLSKTFICNLMTFASRSRRKGDTNKENRVTPCVNKKTGISLSTHTNINPNSQIYKAEKQINRSDLCICDSIDNEMLKRLVALPSGMNKCEWIASHVLPIFENVNALCGSISELCTASTCNVMTYPGCPKAYWLDERGKRYVYSATNYIDSVMSFCEKTRTNEAFFPTKYGNDFSPCYEQQCKKIFKLLWHCCGHLYGKHWDDLGRLNLRSQCSMLLAHILTIGKEFGLLDSKDLVSIHHIVNLIRPYYIQNPAGTNLSPSIHNNQENSHGSCSSSRVPTSKSGSWGGYPSPNVLGSKAYAQTC
uniref:MOB kinase activator-like 2 n=1 Tax=Rhabditophanes sp. KR3021 TaxID=114890 RepID=A0AC35TYE7_9BILA